MNNRIKILIIAGSLFLIILIIFFSIISKNFQFGPSSNINPTPVETKKYETETTRKINSMTLTQKRNEAKKMASETENLLTNEQKENLKKLKDLVQAQQNGFVETEDFKIGYSDLKNQFYIQKKSTLALEKLKDFLSSNNVLDIYTQDPYFFVLTNDELQTYISKQEEQRINEWEESEYEPGGSVPIGGANGAGGAGSSTEGTEEITGTGGTSITQTPGSMSQTEKEYYQKRTETRQNNLNIALDLFHSFTNPSNGSGPRLYDNLTMIEEEITPTQIPLPSFSPTNPSEIITPANLGTPNDHGYYRLPSALNGEYELGGWNYCGEHSWGSQALINVITTASRNWHNKYPGSKFVIGDLNGPKSGTGAVDRNGNDCGHSTHDWGVTFDPMPKGSPGFCDQNKDPNGTYTTEVGKMLIDTGKIRWILYGGDNEVASAQRVRDAWKAYANSKGLYFESSRPSRTSHQTHCDIRIYAEYELPTYRPTSCCNR